MDVQEEVKRIEKELTDIVIAKLQENKMDSEQAKKFAADFLNILPVADQKDLLEKLKAYADAHKEAQGVYAEELSKASENERDQVLSQMRSHIQSGNIENAITAAKTLSSN